jgi:hypothetical protein
MRTSDEIREELALAISARKTALQAQSYSLDTGQGKQTVERADLDKISKTIKILQDELEEALDSENGVSGLSFGTFERY